MSRLGKQSQLYCCPSAAASLGESKRSEWQITEQWVHICRYMYLYCKYVCRYALDLFHAYRAR